MARNNAPSIVTVEAHNPEHAVWLDDALAPISDMFGIDSHIEGSIVIWTGPAWALEILIDVVREGTGAGPAETYMLGAAAES